MKTEILARHKMAVAYHVNCYDLLTRIGVVEIRDIFTGLFLYFFGGGIIDPFENQMKLMVSLHLNYHIYIYF